mmetsp:Transcript_10673/g.30350  ORF Transcript_10673/g.30350 Transcript_10673/m.30350 type:complete len:122 (+) Transcript_10673:1494-1859(+)
MSLPPHMYKGQDKIEGGRLQITILPGLQQLELKNRKAKVAMESLAMIESVLHKLVLVCWRRETQGNGQLVMPILAMNKAIVSWQGMADLLLNRASAVCVYVGPAAHLAWDVDRQQVHGRQH